MFKLLLAENNLSNIHLLINILGDVFHNNIVLAKLCLSNLELYKIDNYSAFDILLINDNNIESINVYDLIRDTREKLNVIMISDENHISNHKNFHVTKTVTGAINILNNLYVNINMKHKNLGKILDIFSFNKSSIGYKYIIDLLDICIDENYTHIPTLNQLYSKIAFKYGMPTPESVGWNIEKTIRNMKMMTKSEIIDKYFGYSPSPKIFFEIILNMYNNLNKKM